MGRSLASPFGMLLAEIREERRLSCLALGKVPAPMDRRPGPEAQLRIETRVVSDARPWGPRPISWLGPSLFVHATLLLAGALAPIVMSEALPQPAPAATRVFFVTPREVVPVLPPPPPAPVTAAAPRAPVASSLSTDPSLVAPVEVPDEVTPEASGVEVPTGEPGGVEGGVPGGVVGAIVEVPEPPPPPIEPVRPGGKIREPTKVKDVAPVYPDVAVAANVQGTVVLECLVTPQGRVSEVKLLRGIPLLNEAAVAAVSQWVYTPTLRDGVPVPVLLTVTVKFTL